MKRILLIHDWCSVGKVAAPLMVPVLSVLEVEVVVVPTMLLSTHTGGFQQNVMHTVEVMPDILQHIQQLPLSFDGIVTGYFGSIQQLQAFLKQSLQGFMIVDPVMADRGQLYRGFNQEYVDTMKQLASKATVILPNLTEACLLTDTRYHEQWTKKEIDELAKKLHQLGIEIVILTGVSFNEKEIGFYVSQKTGEASYIAHKKIKGHFFGTGDFVTAMVSAGIVAGYTVEKVLRFAADCVNDVLEKTIEAGNPVQYGLAVEQTLPQLMKRWQQLRKECEQYE